MALAGLRPNEERTVRGVVEWARERFGDRLVDIRLFGSKARGDSDPESDIDLFMLLREELTREEKEELSRVKHDLDLENGTVTMAIIETAGRWCSPLVRATLFHKNVEQEGVGLLMDANTDVARLRLSQAEETLREADLMLQAGYPRGGVNRAYYAAFYAARALLTTKELDSARHAGVLALFDEHFVHSGTIAREHSTAIHALFDLRLQSDYRDHVALDAEQAREQLGKAEAFVAAVREALESLLAQEDDGDAPTHGGK